MNHTIWDFLILLRFITLQCMDSESPGALVGIEAMVWSVHDDV